MPRVFFPLLFSLLLTTFPFFVLLYLFVKGLDLFDFVVATHEDARTVVNVFRNDFEKTLHLAIDSLAAS